MRAETTWATSCSTQTTLSDTSWHLSDWNFGVCQIQRVRRLEGASVLQTRAGLHEFPTVEAARSAPSSGRPALNAANRRKARCAVGCPSSLCKIQIFTLERSKTGNAAESVVC